MMYLHKTTWYAALLDGYLTDRTGSYQSYGSITALVLLIVKVFVAEYKREMQFLISVKTRLAFYNGTSNLVAGTYSHLVLLYVSAEAMWFQLKILFFYKVLYSQNFIS